MRKLLESVKCRLEAPDDLFHIDTKLVQHRPTCRILELMQKSFSRLSLEGRDNFLRLYYNVHPVALEEEQNGYRITLKSSKTMDSFSIVSQLIISCIGFRNHNDFGLPTSANSSFTNKNGFIQDNIFTAGWAQSGPLGAITETMLNSFSVVDEILSMKCQLERQGNATNIPFTLHMHHTSFKDWEKIDNSEILNGMLQGKLRSKTTIF